MATYSTSIAQTKSEQELLKAGNKLFYEENFAGATTYFLQLLSLNQTNAEYNYKYGTCVLYSDGEKSKALKYLLFAASKPVGLDKEVNYHAARALHLNYRFAEAIKYYQKYQLTATDKDKEKYQIARQIEMCSNGKRLLRNITDLVVISKKDFDETNFYRLYSADAIEGKILVVQDLQTSADKKKDHKIIINLPKTSDIVYFSSYGDDGKSLDIYCVKRLPGNTWSKPQIIRGLANTQYDEDYPYMHPDGRTLYFCSKGHNSMGGYDVFKSNFDPETETFSTPENLDFAVNTPDDDILYILDSLEQSAFFASKRESGFGKVHVYNVRVERFPVLIAILKGKFVNEINTGANGATITVENMVNSEVEGIFNTKTSTGDYLITLDKSGKYKYKVKVEGSDEIHEAIVDVPYQKELRPLKQEIALVNKDGSRQVVIRNMFDQEIEGSDDIIAEVLKNKASLNPNADAFVDELAKKKEKDSIVDVSIGENLTNEDLIKLAKEQAANQRKESDELKEKLNAAYNVAAIKMNEAKEKSANAEKNIAEADEIIDPLEKGMLYDQAKKDNDDANKAANEAVVALNLAKNLEPQVDKANKDADVASNYAKGIEDAINSKNKDEAIKKLKEQQAYIKSLMTGDAEKDDYYAETKKKAAAKKEEANKALTLANRYKDQEVELTTDINQLNREAEKAKGAKKKEIEDKIKALQNDLATVTERKKDAFRNAENLTKEADQIDDQAELLAGILENTSSNNKVLSQSEKDALATNIQSESKNIQGNSEKIDQKVQVDRDKKFNYNDFLAKYDYYANMFNEYERLKANLLSPDDYDRLIAHNDKWMREIDDDLAKTEKELVNADGDQKKQLEAKKQQLAQLKANKDQENKDLKIEKQKLLDRLASNNKSNDKVKDLNDPELTTVVSKNENKIKEIENSNSSTERKTIEKNKANKEYVTDLNKQIEKEKKTLAVSTDETEKEKTRNKIAVLEETKDNKQNEIAANNKKLEESGLNPSLTETVSDKVKDNSELSNNANVEKQVTKTNTLKEEIADLTVKKNETTDQKQKDAIDKQIKDKEKSLYKEEEKLAETVKTENNNNYTKKNNEIEDKIQRVNLSKDTKENAETLTISAEKDKKESDELFVKAKNENDPTKKNEILEEAITKQNDAIKKQNDALTVIETNKKGDTTTLVENTNPTNTTEKNPYTVNETNYTSNDSKNELNTLKTELNGIQDKKNEIQVLKNELAKTTDQTKKDELTTTIANKEKTLITAEIAVADNFEKLNNSQISTNRSAINETITKIDESKLDNTNKEKLKDANQIYAEVGVNVAKADALRIKGNDETNLEAKNNLFKEANQLELETIAKQNEAKKLFEEVAAGNTSVVVNNNPPTNDNKELLAEVSNDYNAKLDEIKNSNQSDIRKTQAENELNKDIVNKIENEITKLNSSEAGLTEEEKRKRRLKIEELNRLLDAKKKELGITEEKLKEANVIASENQSNKNDYSNTLIVQNSNAAAEKLKIDKTLSEIDSEKIKLTETRIKIAESTDQKEKDKLEKEAKASETKIIQKEIAIAPSIDKINEIEFNSHKGNIASKQLELTESGISVDNETETRLKSLLNEAETLNTEGNNLREQAAKEKDQAKKNDLLKQAHQKETDAIRKLIEAETLINKIKGENSSSENAGLVESTNATINEVDNTYANNLKEIETSNESNLKKTLKKEELNEDLVSKIESEKIDLTKDYSNQTPGEKERRRLKLEELNRILDQKKKELDAENALLNSNEIKNKESEKTSYNEPYPIKNASSKSLLIEGKVKIDDLNREEAKLNDLEIKKAEATTTAEKKKIDGEIKNQEKIVVEKELGVAKLYADINQYEIKDNRDDLNKLMTRVVDNKNINKNDPQLILADNNVLSANKNLREAADLRAKAEKESDKTKKDILLKNAFELEKKAIKQQRDAIAVYETMLGNVDTNLANNNDVPVIEIDENPENRPSNRELKKYESLIAEANYLEMRSNAVRDSVPTVKKKYREGLIREADNLKAQSIDKRNEAELAKSNYDKLKSQEDEQLVIQRKKKEEAELAKSLEPEVSKMNEYAKFYQLQKDANTTKEQLKSDSNNAELKSKSENQQLLADNYLASIESNKAEKINKVVGPNRTNLISPEVTFVENTPLIVNDPVQFAKDFKAPKEITNNIFVKSNAPGYNNANPIPVNPEMPKGTYYMVQVGAFRNPIPQDLFKEFVPIRGETTPTGLTRYTVGYFTDFNSANEAKKEIRGFGYKDAFVVGFKDGNRVGVNTLPALANNNPINNNPINNNPVNNNPVNNNPINNNPVNNPPVNLNIAEAGNQFNNFTPDNNKIDYYKNTPNAAKANQVEVIKGLFYTVQVGVYSKPVSLDKLYGIQPLNSELTASKKIRYTTGIYTKFPPADSRKSEARGAGIKDAFVTAYFNGKKITLEEARQLIDKYGETIFADPNNLSVNGNNVVVNNNGNNNPPNNENTNPSLTKGFHTIVLGEYPDDIPSKDAEIYINNNSKYKILKTKLDGKSIYFIETEKGTSEADKIKTHFDDEGLKNVKVIDTKLKIQTENVNNNPPNNNPPTNNPPANTGFHTIALGEYPGEVPNKDAEIFIKNNSKYKILKTNMDGKSVYFVETEKGKADADKTKNYFKDQGLTNPKVIDSKLKVENAANNATIIQPKKVNNLKFQVYLGEYLDEVPEDDAMIYINNVSKGVKRKVNAEGFTIYYTCDCEDYDQALELKAHFIHEGITAIRIVPFNNEKEITVGEAFKLIYE